MKKLMVFGLLLVLVSSCEKEKQRYFSESAEIETLKKGIEAYESQDWDAWKSHFAENAHVFVNSKDSITVDTRMADLKTATGMMSSYGFERENEWIEMVLDKDDETWVYYWAQWNGVFEANNATVSVPVHLAVHFENGKIVSEHVYYDATEMNEIIEDITEANDNGMEVTEEVIVETNDN